MISATRLFVGNLPEDTEEKELYSVFSGFGTISTLDLKLKAAPERKKFAFISLSASNVDVESCTRLYVTRARESFLERLQRERDEAQRKEAEKGDIKKISIKKTPIIKLGEKLNPRKRKIESFDMHEVAQRSTKQISTQEKVKPSDNSFTTSKTFNSQKNNNVAEAGNADKKKYEAERKRMESMKKKRQEFKEKQMIIKTGLTSVDNIKNKKLVFADEVDSPMEIVGDNKKSGYPKKKPNSLFDENCEDSDNEPNFEVKKQFEGKKGQKILDLQSRYKSDKRFTLDERFVDEEEADDGEAGNEEVELGHADEKAKQLNILQDVLGVTLQTRSIDSETKKNKPKLGMLRFDPMQPDHAKFLAPIETKPETSKKSKNKTKEKITLPEPDVPKVEVSKEQFYTVSDTLKEAIAQPNTFSLRSLFGNNKNVDEGPPEQDIDYIPLETPKEKKKIKNPLDPKEKNPFVYDSSDSEAEEPENEVTKEVQPPSETKAVWKENLFFSLSDPRLKEGLAFFNKLPNNEVQKERRELKSLVKKRMYNNDRKNQMFKKKIGGRKKSMKKPHKNKS